MLQKSTSPNRFKLIVQMGVAVQPCNSFLMNNRNDVANVTVNNVVKI